MAAIGTEWATTLTTVTVGMVGVVSPVSTGCLDDELDSATIGPRCSRGRR
jgi:hypothetical protein